jgi:tetratricopeptide (TPR) repeat protein
MVFEHRNHLPLIGITLALGDLFLLVCQRLHLGHRVIIYVFAIVSLLLAASTLHQAYIWGDSGRLGYKMTKLVPSSERAWNQYAIVYYSRYNITKKPEDLLQAIRIMEDALKHIPSPLFISNIIIYKATLGTLQDQDWKRFYPVLEHSTVHLEQQQAVGFLQDAYIRGFNIDENKLIASYEVIEKQNYMASADYLAIANRVYNSKRRDQAIIFFRKYVEVAPLNDPMVKELLESLADGGHSEWVQQLQDVRANKSKKKVVSNF